MQVLAEKNNIFIYQFIEGWYRMTPAKIFIQSFVNQYERWLLKGFLLLFTLFSSSFFLLNRLKAFVTQKTHTVLSFLKITLNNRKIIYPHHSSSIKHSEKINAINLLKRDGGITQLFQQNMQNTTERVTLQLENNFESNQDINIITLSAQNKTKKQLINKLMQHLTTQVWQQYRFYWQYWQYFSLYWGGRRAKRMLDIVVSSIVLLCLSPLFLVVMALIYIDSPGSNVFFKQTRVGKRGRHFTMWKFRSMQPDAEKHKDTLLQHNEMRNGVLFKIKADPRITRVGKFIRKYSIDELPQLWNVLRGDMSLVGPRPPLPCEVAQYTPYQMQRLEVKPGITCIWQISGRSELPFHTQVELDLHYIATQSFWTDLRLLIKTIPAILKGNGAW
jgi:exopolysaccharide biosynthesis polyprenyl glycosylphosphotransferase